MPEGGYLPPLTNRFVLIEVADVIVEDFFEHDLVLLDKILYGFFACLCNVVGVVEADPAYVRVKTRRRVHHRSAHFAGIDVLRLVVR